MFHDYAPVFIIGMLNSFAEKTENGIIDFDTLSMSISAGAASWSRMAVGTFPISIRPVA